MKKISFVGLILLTLFLFPWSCVRPVGVGPQYMATPTPTCLGTNSLNYIYGSYYQGPGPVTIALLTPTPYPTPLPWSGPLPPHVGGEYVIRTASDWSNYLATSQFPAATVPIPFNPNTQMLVVIADASASCSYNTAIQDICNDGSQIVINVTKTMGCCGNPPISITTGSLGVILNKSSLPVIWNNTVIPLSSSTLCV